VSEDVFEVIFRMLAALPEKMEKLQMEELRTAVAYRELADKLEKKGYGKYAEKLRDIAFEESKHADFFRDLREEMLRRGER
jgi:rubrerythrin